jgi:hypothetical protein
MATFKLRGAGVRCGNCDLPARELSSLTRSSIHGHEIHVLVCRFCYTRLTATEPPLERPRPRAPVTEHEASPRGPAPREPVAHQRFAAIARALADAGWTPADRAPSADGGAGVDLLEYRITTADGRSWRLDVCGVRRLVTAELWSPHDLDAAVARDDLPAIDEVTRRHRRWRCDPDGDQEAQGRDIGRAIAAWSDRMLSAG